MLLNGIKLLFLVMGTVYVPCSVGNGMYEGWNFNCDNYLFTTDTK